MNASIFPMFEKTGSSSTERPAMALFDRLAANAIVPVLVCLCLTAYAKPDVDKHIPFLNGNESKGDFDRAFSNEYFKSCHTTSCEALRDINDLLWVILDRGLPNTIAKLEPLPNNYRQSHDAKITRLLALHSERREAYCKILIGISTHSLEWAPEQPRISFSIIEIASRMRSRFGMSRNKGLDGRARCDSNRL